MTENKIIKQINKIHEELNVLFNLCSNDCEFVNLIKQIYEALGDVEDYYWDMLEENV